MGSHFIRASGHGPLGPLNLDLPFVFIIGFHIPGSIQQEKGKKGKCLFLEVIFENYLPLFARTIHKNLQCIFSMIFKKTMQCVCYLELTTIQRVHYKKFHIIHFCLLKATTTERVPLLLLSWYSRPYKKIKIVLDVSWRWLVLSCIVRWTRSKMDSLFCAA